MHRRYLRNWLAYAIYTGNALFLTGTVPLLAGCIRLGVVAAL